MRRVYLALLMTLLTPAAVVHAQQNDTTAVMATLDRFTAALRVKDTTGMKAELHEQARMTLLRNVVTRNRKLETWHRDA